MVKPYLRQSPLAHLHLEMRTRKSEALSVAGVQVLEIADRAQIVVRGQSADPAFLQGVEKALGQSLPIIACTSVGDPTGLYVLWMGPDEWLVVAPEIKRSALLAGLAKALRGLHCAIVDVSESRTVIQLQGQEAKTVLDKGCSIDLHPRSFGPGRVANTLLARCHITLHQTVVDLQTGHPSFDIYVHRSFAEYLWTWIEDASREYGLDVGS